MRAAPGAVLTQSTASTHDVSDMLRHYPSGMLSTPLDIRSATFGYRYGSGSSVSVAAPGGSGGESVGVSGGAFTDLVTHRHLGIGFVLARDRDRDVLGGRARALAGPWQVDRRGISRRLARYRPSRGVPRHDGDSYTYRVDLRARHRDAVPLALHPARDALPVALGYLGTRRRGDGRLDPRAPGAQAAGGLAPPSSQTTTIHMSTITIITTMTGPAATPTPLRGPTAGASPRAACWRSASRAASFHARRRLS